MVSGKGAGGLPTASAVISDIIDSIFSSSEKTNTRNLEEVEKWLSICDPLQIESSFYLRVEVPDTPGVLEIISKTLVSNKISIAKIVQKTINPAKATLIIVTHPIKEVLINNAIKDLRINYKIENCLRIGLN